jgi:hypothetical protein
MVWVANCRFVAVQVVLSVALLAPCSAGSVDDFRRALDVCDVIADANAYDGEEILIRGPAWWTPHGPAFGSHGCEASEVLLPFGGGYPVDPHALEVARALLRERVHPVLDMVFQGKFHIVTEPGIHISGAGGYYAFTLDVSRLVAARRSREKGD